MTKTPWNAPGSSGFDNVYGMLDRSRAAAKIEDYVPVPTLRHRDPSREPLVVATIELERAASPVVSKVKVVSDVDVALVRAVNDNNITCI